MKRSGFGPRKTPMSRSAFKVADKSTAMRRTAIKSRPKKATVAEGSKYLAACRGEMCFLQIEGVCCNDWQTVVPAHSNESAHGKGMGKKADHQYTLPACFTCHMWLDQGKAPRDQKVGAWRLGFAQWEPRRARKMGLSELEAA